MLARVSVLQAYKDQLAEHGFTADPAQLRAAERLEQCSEEWADYKAKRGGTLKKMISKPPLPRGVYLWGGVGRGKSLLMDCFYQHVPLERKVRLHFHEFMRATHREMHDLRGTENPLDEVAQRVARRYRLICFDEFHVSDIADAMILERLLRALFDSRVGFIMTSNYHPDGLYPDGLHRDRMLPAIALIKQHMDVVEVDGGVDYRRLARSQVRAYLTPLDDASEQAMQQVFDQMARTQSPAPALNASATATNPVLQIESREIRAHRRLGRVQQFDCVCLSGVPAMSAAMSSEARRFTWLVDVLYDHKVKLIISAEVPPEQLYTEGVLANEFARTVSRLVEMQSEEYLASAQRSVQSSFVPAA
jgi:cell division protein ZapE